MEDEIKEIESIFECIEQSTMGRKRRHILSALALSVAALIHELAPKERKIILNSFDREISEFLQSIKEVQDGDAG